VRTIIDFIELPVDPPVDPPPPVETDSTPPQPTEFTAFPDVIERTSGPATTQEPPRQVDFADAGTAVRDIPDLPPVRLEALFDPRFAADQQPPYPTSEERAQREGRVRLRVTIGADGRVKAVQRLDATSDAFWRSTERHALSRWRFRPATDDGRPVESTKVLTITFQIEV
jgi:protein TonB